MRIGDTLKKAAGLFVEFDQPVSTPESEYEDVSSQPTKTVEQIVREQPGPNLDEIKPSAAVAPAKPVVGLDGQIHFTSIYDLANLPESAFTAEQVLELLASFPPELPISAKRAAVKVTLDTMAKTVGVTHEAILADASRKLAALAAYAQSYSEQADTYVAKAEAEIQALEAQIANMKSSIADAKQKKEAMVDACTTESDRLDDVLEFFTLDKGPSKLA